MKTTPKEQAIALLADYSAAQATLKAAVAPYEAQAAEIHAAIAKATAAEKIRLDEIEARLKALALEHGEAIFGAEKRSLVEGGFKLALREVEEIEMDGDEERVCRVILRQLKQVEKRLEEAEAVTDAEALQSLTCERVALSSLLVTTHRINRDYIKANADDAAGWFEQWGLRVVVRESASVKPAPKPRATKAVKKVAKTEDEP